MISPELPFFLWLTPTTNTPYTWHAPQTDPDGHRAHELTLRLVGRIKRRVPYAEENEADIHGSVITQQASILQVVLSEERELGSFAGRVATGLHTFPFSFSLPPGLPPGMKVCLVWYCFNSCFWCIARSTVLS